MHIYRYIPIGRSATGGLASLARRPGSLLSIYLSIYG